MAPKKKGGKKQDDDWEAELGEAAPSAAEPTANDDKGDEAPEMGGGLLAALKKTKNKRAKKGKPTDDFVEGEDPPAENGTDAAAITAKAPEEANMDDEDIHAGSSKKGKPGKQGNQKQSDKNVDEEKEEEGGLKSKKEKEKEKREREKQRKKEQVCYYSIYFLCAFLTSIPGCKEEDYNASPSRHNRARPESRRSNP